MCKYLSLLISLFISVTIIAQPHSIVINKVIFEGNSHTTDKAIQKELDFSAGDTLSLVLLNEIFQRNKLYILSTGLFNQSEINLINYDTDKNLADIVILLQENWYLFPVPIFELADRNFSVWWQEQHKSLSRVNYGFRIAHYNLTGNRDPIKFKAHVGYTKKYQLEYSRPYLAIDNKLGLGMNIFYSENKEIGYKTIANKTLYAKNEDERKLLSRFRVGPELKFRPDVNNFHALRIEYHHNKIDPFVANTLNEEYFLDGKTNLRFFFIEYDYNFDKRSLRQYPLGGNLLFFNIKKEGLGVFGDHNSLSITAGIENHISPLRKIYFSNRNKAKVNLIRNQAAFANNTGLGWDEDIVSGYELYVMDGTDYVISMNAVKWQVLENNMKMIEWFPKQFKKMNLAIFIRVNLDFAFVNEPLYRETNSLNNRWIYGYGPAIDFILFNNFLFSFEYSFNDIGERGLFFHNSFAF